MSWYFVSLLLFISSSFSYSVSTSCTDCCHARQKFLEKTHENNTISCLSIQEPTLCADNYGDHCLWSCNGDIFDFDYPQSSFHIKYIKTINITTTTTNVSDVYPIYGAQSIYTLDGCSGIVYQISALKSNDTMHASRRQLVDTTCDLHTWDIPKPLTKKVRKEHRQWYRNFGFHFCSGVFGKGRELYGRHIQTPLYHATSEKAALGMTKQCEAKIKDGATPQSVMRIGRWGWWGPGIYFAHSAESAMAKSQHGLTHMVLASVADGHPHDAPYSRRGRKNQQTGCYIKYLAFHGCDSIYVDSMRDCYEGMPEAGGPEFVVYQPDQVIIERIYDLNDVDNPLFVYERKPDDHIGMILSQILPAVEHGMRATLKATKCDMELPDAPMTAEEIREGEREQLAYEKERLKLERSGEDCLSCGEKAGAKPMEHHDVDRALMEVAKTKFSKGKATEIKEGSAGSEGAALREYENRMKQEQIIDPMFIDYNAYYDDMARIAIWMSVVFMVLCVCCILWFVCLIFVGFIGLLFGKTMNGKADFDSM